MRRLLCLTTAGLFLAGGTATAATQPSAYESNWSMGKAVTPQSLSSPQWAGPASLIQPPPQPGPPWSHPDPPRPGPTWRPDPPRPPHPGPTWRPDPPRPGPTWRPDPPRPPWPDPPRPPWPDPRPPRPPWPPHPGPTQGWPKELTLTVAKTSVPPFRPRVVRLRCDPPYGSHPRAAEACALLNRAQGDPDRIRARQEFCRRDYDPVKATATGVWNRRPIRYERTFSNPCVMRNATGAVFSF
ncbi:hypothetical protein DKM19_08040 [Streptosporangium sp. 'caverna']|nr:hypothetical protein DKM19_08040 [Streptosporangium sp. 'caverna']